MSNADQATTSRGAVLTGGNGFLGWHTRCALRETETPTTCLSVGDHFDQAPAVQSLDGSDRLIHMAGVNRASEEEVRGGNLLFAQQMAEALQRCERPPRIVVYANSTQAGNGSVYGAAKAEAGDILATAAGRVGAEFVDVRLPNLFGEHGRPFYNAVTATFCHLLAEGSQPTVENDKELTLLHAQNAADVLVGAVEPSTQATLERRETVSGLLSRLRVITEVYGNGEIPDIRDSFDRDLFNTYRSYAFASSTPIKLTRHADPRGSFFEIIRSHGGSGQSSFSTTVPGISRGDHYHRRKVERFTVLAGRATISLRKLFTDEVVHYEVTGEEPVAIDMPTGWAHKITNTGDGDLYTSFWTNDIFDPNNPDTITEVV